MKRKRRTEILINGSHELVKEFAEEVFGNFDVKIIQKPENGLVMLKVRETSKKSLYYPGEVFVTECKVQVEESIGVGIVMGDHPELAYNLAVVDAAFGANVSITENWIPRLLEEEKRINQQKAAMQSDILKTKVNFENMDVS
ncbi:phosphonate C-P lyase system protein PhnG [Cytobacillus gottheilii]|uniref:phosphonate C-P lyase system protein PhnG n=1 Tax=Cytobacillus gottheilii TaxID=859144 RepID=UPI0009BC6161|nr:phosphonate C-P lyase system protein PhnG [Cytobacillus gottheilii]